MDEIEKIAESADMIVNGYSFTLAGSGTVRVLNLNSPDRAAVFSLGGGVLETSMDDIEIAIVANYLARNREFIEATHA